METLLSVRNLNIGVHPFDKPKSRRNGKPELLSSVKDVSFDISGGEIVGLLGESGSGKSLSALSIISLLGENKEVTGGSVLFSGGGTVRDLLTLSEKEMQVIRGKEISMVFQEPFSSLNPLLKIGKQIAETLELHGERDKTLIKGRVKELAEKLRLVEPEKILDSYPHQLSGGMCQRIMIALAVICRPRLLIADEPTTALDQNTQNQILTVLREINRDF